MPGTGDDPGAAVAPSAMHAADKSIGVGIVGAGWMGQVHAASWVANAPRGEIVAVADVSAPRARALSTEYTSDNARVYGDLDHLLADPAVDAVDVCLPHHLHADAITRAARAGKHIFCEKPLCLSFDEARAIKLAIESANVILVCAHNNLFQLPLVEAQRLVGAGVLGRVYYIESFEIGRNTGLISRRPPLRLVRGEDTFSWRLDPVRMGGAELLDTGWHGAYRLLALADAASPGSDVRPTEVSAMLSNQHIRELLPGEDTAHVLVRFSNGLQGSILTSWAFDGEPNAWQFRVSGQHGTLAGAITRLVHAPTGWSSSPAERTWNTTHDKTYVREVTHFLDVLLDGADSQASWRHAARTLQLIRGAYLSAEQRRTVELPEEPTEL
jgi:predicted dehydrogenase